MRPMSRTISECCPTCRRRRTTPYRLQLRAQPSCSRGSLLWDYSGFSESLTVFGGLAGRQSIAITGGIVTFISVIVLFLGGGIAAFLDRHNTSHTRKRNYFVCPHCTYQLRGLPSPGACPECGRVYTADSLKQDWENIIAMEKSGP